MNIGFGLNLNVNASQQLVLTPQLKQAIKILQMSSIELQQEVQQQLESNPLLEEAEEVDVDETKIDEINNTEKNNENLVENRYSINDFDYKNEDSREVIADDFILAIKRLANPKNPSPILAMMQERIDGLKEFAELLKKENTAKNNANSNANSNDDINAELDYRKYNISGVTKIDNYTWQIKIKGKYPQFLYWQTMPFFAAIPYEAIMFYSQPKMAKHNLTLDWFPVGSGAFMITENNPNKRIVL